MQDEWRLLLENSSVCIITQNQGFGGMEVHTLGLINALIDRGYSIELITNRYHRYDELILSRGWQDKVDIVHTDLGGILYGDRIDSGGWWRALSGLRSEVLVFPKGNNNFGHIRLLRLCRRKFKKVIFIEHLEAIPRPPRSSRRWAGLIPGVGFWWHKRRFLSRLGSTFADRIIAVSGSVRGRLIEDLQYPPEKVVMVHNGVPWRELLRDEARGRAFRQRHQIPEGMFVFGMLTRLSQEKGIHTALQAMRRVVSKRPGCAVMLLIAGEGPLAQELKDLSSALNLQDHVRFIGFIQDPKEVLSGYDAILFSSRQEGLPLGLLEGMAAGCIPIVTRISGMPEAVNGLEIGWVVSPDSSEELSAAMLQLLELDTAELARMRENVTRRIQQHFDVAECYRQILDVCGLNV